MKQYPAYQRSSLWLFLFLLLAGAEARGQICTNTLDSVVAMTTSGDIYPLSINTADTGHKITTVPSALNSNGIGFSSLNGKFYFFLRAGNTSTPYYEFGSYDPATGSYTKLADPPNGVYKDKIRSGTVDNAGTGYYTIDPTYGVSKDTPALLYYSIPSNTWTLIGSVYKDASLTTDYTADFKSLNSGDMAFDGAGNLWMIISKSTNYGLYKISAPVPTAATSPIIVQEMIPATTPTPSAVSITGFAFNSVGTMYLATGSGTNFGNNKLYKLNSVGGAITYVDSFPLGDVGGDLTSCSYPTAVLANPWLRFTAGMQQDHVQLNWQSGEPLSSIGYFEVQHSADRRQWISIQMLDRLAGGLTENYSAFDSHFNAGLNFYRVVLHRPDGKLLISPVQLVDAGTAGKLAAWTDAGGTRLLLQSGGMALPLKARIFDQAGRLLLEQNIYQSVQGLDISKLGRGVYIVAVSSPLQAATETRQFIK